VQTRLHNRGPWTKALFRRRTSTSKGGRAEEREEKKMRACKAKRHSRVRDRERSTGHRDNDV